MVLIADALPFPCNWKAEVLGVESDVKEMTELVFEKAKGEYRKYYEPLCADVFGGMPDTMSAVISAAQTAVNSAS